MGDLLHSADGKSNAQPYGTLGTNWGSRPGSGMGKRYGQGLRPRHVSKASLPGILPSPWGSLLPLDHGACLEQRGHGLPSVAWAGEVYNRKGGRWHALEEWTLDPAGGI